MRPGSHSRPRQCGEMVAHWASVKTVRIKVASHVGNSESVIARFGNPQTSTRPRKGCQERKEPLKARRAFIKWKRQHVPVVIHPNVHFIMDSVLSVWPLLRLLRNVDQHTQVGVCRPVLENVLRDGIGDVFKLTPACFIVRVQQIILITPGQLEE